MGLLEKAQQRKEQLEESEGLQISHTEKTIEKPKGLLEKTQ